jgi:hypothetical protein
MPLLQVLDALSLTLAFLSTVIWENLQVVWDLKFKRNWSTSSSETCGVKTWVRSALSKEIDWDDFFVVAFPEFDVITLLTDLFDEGSLPFAI